MQFFNKAFGLCAHCGEHVEESFYWTPLSPIVWETLRSSVAFMFPDKMVQNIMFFPEYSEPFCNAKCSLRWYEEKKGAK